MPELDIEDLFLCYKSHTKAIFSCMLRELLGNGLMPIEVIYNWGEIASDKNMFLLYYLLWKNICTVCLEIQ